jgi:hypothetical protein
LWSSLFISKLDFDIDSINIFMSMVVDSGKEWDSQAWKWDS